MKTSTKLLIGLLAVIIAINLFVLIKVRLYFESTQKNFELPDYEYSVNMVQSEKNLEKFHRLTVDGFTRVNYYKSDSCRISVNANKKIADKLEYKVYDNTLTINVDGINPKKEQVAFNIYCDSLDLITLVDGARLETDNIDNYTCKIVMRGSVFNASVNVTNLKIDQSSRSRVSIEGRSENLDITSYENSVFNALELDVKNAAIKASSSSKLDVDVNGSMKLDISENSVLRYIGNPVIENINISSGAQIIKIDNEEK